MRCKRSRIIDGQVKPVFNIWNIVFAQLAEVVFYDVSLIPCQERIWFRNISVFKRESIVKVIWNLSAISNFLSVQERLTIRVLFWVKFTNDERINSSCRTIFIVFNFEFRNKIMKASSLGSFSLSLEIHVSTIPVIHIKRRRLIVYQMAKYLFSWLDVKTKFHNANLSKSFRARAGNSNLSEGIGKKMESLLESKGVVV